jgi:hypothetical protein
VTFSSVTLAGWSAGHGAIREILSVPEYPVQVSRVLLIDGLHTGYDGGKPGPLESKLEPDHQEIFLQFARDAGAGKTAMLVTHSEIFPGTFASTTETAEWMIGQLGLKRRPVLRYGPMGTQQVSEVKRGGFRLIGYVGNSAPDPVDQLHSLAEYLMVVEQGLPVPVASGARHGRGECAADGRHQPRWWCKPRAWRKCGGWPDGGFRRSGMSI